MNRTYLSIVLSITMAAGNALAAGGHGHDPKFGGVVVGTQAGDLEIVARPDMLQIHVSDHGNAVNLSGAKAKVTLLNGTAKTEAELTPAGDRLEAKGDFKVARGTKGIAVLTLAGKPPATARFELK